MIAKMAMTANLRNFMDAVDNLMNRPQGTEGMGLLWGEPGEGKSTAVAYIANTLGAVYVRALGCWTVTSMLGELCRELGGERKLRRSDMVEFIVQKLAEHPRPIFVDEADYLFSQFSMIDSLRDIYDMSGSPVILIGMEDIARKLQQHSRIARRITQWIEFTGLTIEDTRLVARDCCEVAVSDDLLTYLHKEAAGNIGRIIIGLTRIERKAKANSLTAISYGDWNEAPLFYDQPTFSSRKKGI